jgi:hypothetical protein
MKADIKTLQDTFKIGYEAFESSRKEAMEIIDLYHNRQYTDSQLNTLADRGQPAETFNIIKLFGRMLIGYYSTIVNNIRVSPTKIDEVYTAAILQDLTDYVFRTNNFQSEGDKIKLDNILVGLMCSYIDVVKNGETDEFGRPKYDIKISHVPALEIVLDPMSRLDDYSDARYIHRFKWISEDAFVNLFGKEKLKNVDAYYNHLEIEEAEFTYTYTNEFHGKYKTYDNYLVVHSIITDEDGKTWSIYWCGNEELSKKEITYKEVKNPYRVQKLNSSNKTEYYGIFREVKASQHAINQALLKIQLMVNTQKAFVDVNAVENLDEFIAQFNRVNGVIPMKELDGYRIENLTREVIDQYTIIDKALDRIQRVLSINDSFLGMAYASDSGTKVKLQQNASVVAQRYSTSKIEQFYRLLGWDIVNLIKQYFTAHDVIRVADTYEGNKWVEINKPLMVPTGNMLPNGMPETKLVFEEVLDPETNEPLVDEFGNIVVAPIPTMDTDIAFTMAEITIEAIAYDDEDERNGVMLEQFINGPIGQMISQVNPAGYLKAGALSVKNLKAKYSMEVAAIVEETAAMLGNNQQAMQAMQLGEVQGQMGMTQSVNQMPGRNRIGRG